MSPRANPGPSIRQPAVAGLFYPEEPDVLRQNVQSLLAASRAPARDDPPVALIVPHAGYIYSGPIAASAYHTLVGFADRYTRVALMGPAHRVAFNGIAGISAVSWQTPLGLVPVDRTAMEALCQLPFLIEYDVAHGPEHCLEVQLPFLQVVLKDFTLVPLLAGRTTAGDAERALDLLDDGRTLIVISSDLSHYHDADSARRLDGQTRQAVERLAPEEVSQENACGRTPLQSLLRLALRKGWSVQTLDLRNSGDTNGPAREVVGYGAWAFFAHRSDTDTTE